jgi:hypothetical protein
MRLVLRRRGWALVAPANDQPERAHVRHGTARDDPEARIKPDCLHTTLAPAALIALAFLSDYLPLATVGAAIRGAHIGYDRLLGYGLKYPSGYKDTHLGHLWWPPEGGGWLPRRPG